MTATELVIHAPVVTEQVVLAAACVDERACEELSLRITADHFIVIQHKAAWNALLELHRRKLSFDLATLRQLGGDDVDVEYLAELIENRPERPPNLEHHVQCLLWDHARLTTAAGPIGELLKSLRDPRESPDRVRALARSVSESLDAYQDRRHLLDSAGLVKSQVEEIDKRLSGQAVWPYGIGGLDADEAGTPRLVPGAARGQMTVVTGISGSGKSPLVANMVLGLAEQERRVLYGSWEIKPGIALEWLGLLSLGYSRSAFQLGRFETWQRVELEDRMHAISQHVKFMGNPFNRVRGENRKKGGGNDRNLDVVHSYIADSGCEVFVADLFERALADSDPDEEKHALFRMQGMATEAQVHMVLVAQQRLKDIEQRPDKRPTREGIKGTGAWVEVPDTILATNRQSLWKPVPDDTIEVHVLKQRLGKWPLLIELDWSADTYAIENGREVPYRFFVDGDETSGGVFDPPKPGGKGGRFGKTRRAPS